MELRIGDRWVGTGHPVYIIAEAGVNHNGSIDMARRLVDAAVDAGADAVKFQSFHADQLVTREAPKAAYQVANTGDAGPQVDMLRGLELSDRAFADLHAYSGTRGITFLSTPFDEQSADMLDALDMPAIKVPSGEITNFSLLRHVAGRRRPIILSTGMSWLSEVERALRTLEDAGAPCVALLHCVSCYPAPAADINLRAMATLRAAFGVPVGYSDHTDGFAVGLAAVALGACIVEKHLTLDRELPGPDHRASLDPREMAGFVAAIRDVEAALGDGRKRPTPGELPVAGVARRSVVAACPIPAGTRVTSDMLAVRRPGTGIPAAARADVVGRETRCAVDEGTVLHWEMLR